MASVTFKQLNKVYDGKVQALKDINLEVNAQDFLVTDRNCHFGFFAVSGQNSVFPPNYDCFRTPNN